ncbi:MAG: cupin domain-containing protein, partial [Chitinophagaceae bacterium]
VKIKGQCVPWHRHENEDELFYIIAGALLMEVEGQAVFTLEAGELFVVKKGAYHRVSSVEDCFIMLVEPRTTEHTGKVNVLITKSIDDQKSAYRQSIRRGL